MPLLPHFTAEQIATAKRYAASVPPADIDPRIETLVHELIGRVADKWTMLILEVLAEKGELRFTRLSELVPASAKKCSLRPWAIWSATACWCGPCIPSCPPRLNIG